MLVYTYSNKSSGNKTKVVSKAHLNAFVNKKKEVFEDVIEELVLISNVVKIEDRIEKSKLDSLLSLEFKNIGIKADYNFGVINKNENKQKVFEKMDKYNEDCSQVINECASSPNAKCHKGECVLCSEIVRHCH